MSNKLLVISNNAFSKVLNNGKTLESFFKGWDKTEIAQLFFSTNEYPDFEFCNNYFKMTEFDILKSLLTFNIKKPGRVVSSQIDEFPPLLKEESGLLKWIKKNAKTFALWRNFLWSFKTWKSETFIKWLYDFNPDFIFFVGGNVAFLHDITQWINNYLKVPYAVYFTDDYIINQTNENLLQWMYQKRLIKYYMNTISNASMCYVVSDLMAKDYSIKFNRNFSVLVNSIDFNNFSIPKKEQNEKNKTMIFSYIGGLHLNRWKSLIELGNLLSEINSELSLECVINIYTVVCPDEKILEQLNNFPLQFKGSLDNIEVIEAIKKSDVLVHVESLDKINRSYTKYSISTKIPEYLASHRCILAYGPAEVASIRILSENHIGVVLTDNDSREEKKEKIRRLIFDAEFRDDLANKGYNFAYGHFDGSTIRENLKNELCSMVYNEPRTMASFYICNSFNSKIVPNYRPLIVRDGYIIGSKGYRIYLYDSRNRMIKESKVIDSKNLFLSSIYLLRRFFRAEITNLYELDDGTQLLIAKRGIFRKRSTSNRFIRCFNIKRGSRPMNLCIDEKNTIYFGEYFSNFQRNPVNIYASTDAGITWRVAYSFKKGEINHIHGIFYDKYTNRKWVVTGDRENECIIAYTENDFEDLNIVFRGGQEYRTCSLLFYEEFIVFVTDSQYMNNAIKKFDRKTLEITTLGSIQGSGIYAGQCNSFSFLSTTVEPSKVNKNNYSHLYISKNGLEWKEIAKYRKDIWNKSLFQFGSIQFPRYENQKQIDYIVYYGRALKQIGGKTVIQSIK